MTSASRKVIDRAVRYIKERIDPEQIYLFGSYAQGRETQESDLDFFIIKDTVLPKYKRSLPLYSLGKSKEIGFSIGMDFIVYTPDEFEADRGEINSVVGEVLRTGKLIYEKTP